MIRMINGVKHYPISERFLFGLESMYDKCEFWLTCEYDKFSSDELDAIEEKRDLCEELLGKAQRGWVDGKTFGKIKEITEEREWMRYRRCLENGMSERDAAYSLG